MTTWERGWTLVDVEDRLELHHESGQRWEVQEDRVVVDSYHVPLETFERGYPWYGRFLAMPNSSGKFGETAFRNWCGFVWQRIPGDHTLTRIKIQAILDGLLHYTPDMLVPFAHVEGEVSGWTLEDRPPRLSHLSPGGVTVEREKGEFVVFKEEKRTPIEPHRYRLVVFQKLYDEASSLWTGDDTETPLEWGN